MTNEKDMEEIRVYRINSDGEADHCNASYVLKKDHDAYIAKAVEAERERLDTKLREALCNSQRIFVTSSGEMIHLDEACKIIRSVILSADQEAVTSQSSDPLDLSPEMASKARCLTSKEIQDRLGYGLLS